MTTTCLVVFMFGVLVGQWLTVWGLLRLYVATIESLERR